MQIVLTLALSLVLAVTTYYLKMLTTTGAIASFVTGAIVGVFGSIEWFILLLLFTATGLIFTKYDFDRKVKEGLQEGKHGERTYLNVLGVGIPPCIIAILYWIIGNEYGIEMTIAFVTTMCVAAADTLASEIGVKDQKVWLITTFKRCAPGTNGGVSVLGTVISLIASIAMAVIGWLLIYQTIDAYVILPIIGGFLGCVFDSILGTAIEDRGWISKYTNNGLTAIMGAVVAVVLFIVIW